MTAPTAEFTFDVTLTDAAGKQLAGTYNYEGDKKGVIENGAGTIALKHDQSVTIKGLPEGAKYKVVETKVDGFAATSDTMNGAIAKNQTAEAAFTNIYTPAPIVIQAAPVVRCRARRASTAAIGSRTSPTPSSSRL